eukprot:gene19628-26312_t
MDCVDYVDRIYFQTHKLSTKMLPPGFKKTDGMVAYEKKGCKTDIAKSFGIETTGRRVEYMQLIPQDPVAFYKHFLEEDGTIKNKTMFLQRIAGVRKNEIVMLPMSTYQYTKYREVRTEEIGKEEAAGRQLAMQMESTGQVYKTFSRLACNFVFPENKKRPFPSNINALNGVEIDEQGAVVTEEGSYTDAIERAMKYIVLNGKRILKDELAKYSAKFRRMVDNIDAGNGTALVYSQFRKVEGLGLFAEVLKQHGYEEFKVGVPSAASGPKFAMFAGDNTREESQIILDMFNNNENKDGFLDVYHYVTTIPPDLVGKDAKLLAKDGGRTTDQIIQELAQKKSRVMGGFLDLLKAAAIDCKSFKQLKNTGECFQTVANDELMYSSDIVIDEFDARASQTAVAGGKQRAVRVDILNVGYIMIVDTQDMYDYKLFKKDIMKYVGKLKDLYTIRGRGSRQGPNVAQPN